MQGQVLFDFLQEHAKDTDVFCFQEVFNTLENLEGKTDVAGRMGLYKELQSLLPDYQPYFSLSSTGHDLVKHVPYNVEEGVATFIKKGLEVVNTASELVFKSPSSIVDPMKEDPSRSLQTIEVIANNCPLYIFNYHGIAYPGTKIDTAERLKQSAKILEAMAKLSGPKILCGDFNLMPDTESIRMLGVNAKDLIKDYAIENTRNEISWKNYNNKQYFADFMFTSSEIKVSDFKVPYILVSDHLPMLVEFEL